MTKQVQRRRGTDTQHTGFTGAEGEISVNTTNKSVHVHDGSTAGGFEAARADLNNVTTANTASKLSGGTVSSLTVTSADINGGTIDGTTIGGSTPAAGSFTNVSVTGTVDGRDVAADGTKLDGIEASADVTDTANVTAAGALMDSELTDIAAVKALDQGVATTDSPSFAGITATTADINGGTIDGVTIGGASAGAGTFTTLTATGNVNVDGGTLFVDVSANAVGIGTTSPFQTNANRSVCSVNGTTDSIFNLGVNGSLNSFFYANASNAILGTDASIPLVFYTSNSERMRIDSSGNLLVGTSVDNVGNVTSASGEGIALSSGTYGGFIGASRSAGVVMTLNRQTTDGGILQFRQAGAEVGLISHDTYGIDIDGRTGYLGLNVNDLTDASTGVEILSRGFTATPRMQPNGDNKLNLGDSGRRWKTVYAVTTTINNSDINEKQDIEELSEAELRVAVACKGLMRKYRWIDAVAEKGDDARIHFGIIAQDLQAAFEAEGLDAHRYAVFCSDTWWEAERIIPAVEAVDAVYETVTIPAVTEERLVSEAVYDDEGNETEAAVYETVVIEEERTEERLVSEAVEAKEAYTRTDTYDTAEEAPEGAVERTRLGVRYSELLAFIIAAI